MRFDTDSERVLVERAAAIARAWRDAGAGPLLVGLRGPLGSGKTTWVRAMLRGLGYVDRVPSPTYTLVEEYRVGAVTIVHADLYRLAAAEELECLGIRDRLDAVGVWLFVEWPERAPALLERCDVLIDFEECVPAGRALSLTAQSNAGRAVLGSISEIEFK